MKGLRRRPSPSLVVGIAALICALAGSAVAAPIAVRSVLDKQEKKQVRNIARGQAVQQINQRAPGLSVASAVDATNAVQARTAADAATVGGLRVVKFRRSYETATDPEDVLALGGLRIRASCGDGGGGPDLVDLQARTTVNSASITVGTEEPGPSNGFAAAADFDTTDSVDLRPADGDRTNGTLTYTSPDGSVVTVNYMTARFIGIRCLVAGVAIGG